MGKQRGRQRGPDIASDIRGAFVRAVKARQLDYDEATTAAARKKRRPLSTIMDDLLESNPLGLLQAMKGFVPRELDVTAIELSHEDWLAQMDAESAPD